MKGVWRISIAGYGVFMFLGNEKQAEETRAHKSNWEGGVGRKEKITVPKKDRKRLIAVLNGCADLHVWQAQGILRELDKVEVPK